ncbi:transcriptional regulator, TetR family [Mesorhizobium albiziae]|uniref:Transcriptional regulator, TetR family n=2 Tax=Neomesorhizobium albiziae TaxID=335020 RepID=A0A1I4BS37_9HYPH|nr:TetR family transcriptional regulator [Mesorhizobium albiziae]SFK71642.1 transcriptional regulator, TetR family [Mesorhizobium albiziae]
MRLFAERGYDRTSVPDIQEAAGLSRGSGALYKHFPSKEALFRIGVERFIQEAQLARAKLFEMDMEPRHTIEWIGRNTLNVLAGKSEELRILWRDVDQFPKIKAAARREIMQGTYAAVAKCLDESARAGRIAAHDSQAVAAVMVGSLAMFRVFEAVWGERAIKIDDDRFLRAWTDMVLCGLKLNGQGVELQDGARPSSSKKRKTQ